MVAEKDRLLNRVEAAEFLGVRPQTLAIWATTGRYGLTLIKVGRLAKYRRSDLEKFLERRTVVGTAEREPRR
jgi:predicted site-specific integrase-resolvase